MFCGLRAYYANSITLKDIYSITYIDYIQTYRLTVYGDYEIGTYVWQMWSPSPGVMQGDPLTMVTYDSGSL